MQYNLPADVESYLYTILITTLDGWDIHSVEENK